MKKEKNKRIFKESNIEELQIKDASDSLRLSRLKHAILDELDDDDLADELEDRGYKVGKEFDDFDFDIDDVADSISISEDDMVDYLEDSKGWICVPPGGKDGLVEDDHGTHAIEIFMWQNVGTGSYNVDDIVKAVKDWASVYLNGMIHVNR